MFIIIYIRFQLGIHEWPSWEQISTISWKLSQFLLAEPIFQKSWEQAVFKFSLKFENYVGSDFLSQTSFAKDMIIVMAKEGDKVDVQKVLHPLVEGKGKIMSKVYKMDQKD